MKLSRLFLAVAASLIVRVSYAQAVPFGQEHKDRLLSEIGRVLTDEAFVPGVDLSRWTSFIDKKKEAIEGTESPTEFAGIVNSALREFGLSHIQVMRSRGRRLGLDQSSYTLQGGQFARGASIRWENDESAVVRVPSFDRTYDEDQIASIFNEASNAKYLVIDLRGNPGGEVEKMRQFLGYVLPQSAPIGTFVSRSVAKDFATVDKSGIADPVAIAKWAKREFRPRRVGVTPFQGKIAVLIDGRSASASEIVAQALSEQLKAPIVGSPSAGAVLVSTFDRLSYGFQIQFPVGDYVSHGGVRLEGNPIKPDLRAGYDAVDVALGKLKG